MIDDRNHGAKASAPAVQGDVLLIVENEIEMAVQVAPRPFSGFPTTRSLFTDEFRTIVRAAGVECLKLPSASPDLNAYAERFVLSIKSECLNKLIPLGEKHLRRAVSEFVEHYHLERNHQGGGEPASHAVDVARE